MKTLNPISLFKAFSHNLLINYPVLWMLRLPTAIIAWALSLVAKIGLLRYDFEWSYFSGMVIDLSDIPFLLGLIFWGYESFRWRIFSTSHGALVPVNGAFGLYQFLIIWAFMLPLFSIDILVDRSLDASGDHWIVSIWLMLLWMTWQMVNMLTLKDLLHGILVYMVPIAGVYSLIELLEWASDNWLMQVGIVLAYILALGVWGKNALFSRVSFRLGWGMFLWLLLLVLSLLGSFILELCSFFLNEFMSLDQPIDFSAILFPIPMLLIFRYAGFRVMHYFFCKPRTS
ncbi:hypothetical protein [Pontibacter sp. G13]|uniref:hypothetical protein n=1 Tax=Pontibacter sp. G13 TaxID=3074898 RepID=UPI0028890402|nr:hypothetical protein [Pontibacter sp. G13]WNJ16312.1 hypothetical protein RJD25_15720 [Pontibacter sp. G13]